MRRISCARKVLAALLVAGLLLGVPLTAGAQSVAGSVNIRALGAVPLSGADVVDAPNSAFRVTVTGPGVSGGLALDATLQRLLTQPLQGVVSSGSPVLTPIGVAPLSLTPLGALRTDASATSQPIRVQDGIGTILATVTSANALKVDGSHQIQPVSGTVTASVTGTVTATQGSPPWAQRIQDGTTATLITVKAPFQPATQADPSLVVALSPGGTVVANQGTGAGVTNAWLTLPGQSSGTANNASTGHVFNNQTTGAADAAVTATFTQQPGTQWRLISASAYCSAGTASLTVTDGGTTIWSTPASAVGTALAAFNWTTPLMFVGAAPAVTLGTCGAANTGTLIIQAARF